MGFSKNPQCFALANLVKLLNTLWFMEIIFLYNKDNQKIVVAWEKESDNVVLKQGTKPCETKQQQPKERKQVCQTSKSKPSTP
jgi:hypothetical protein